MSTSSETARCPHCAEFIAGQAPICPACGHQTGFAVGPTHAPASKPAAKGCWIQTLLVLRGVILVIFLYTQFGLYTIQPIGALPEGGTVLVWRGVSEPFFNSPDALCLDRLGSVSLLCRGFALGEAPTDRIVLRLPYQHWAYLASTGGVEFDR